MDNEAIFMSKEEPNQDLWEIHLLGFRWIQEQRVSILGVFLVHLHISCYIKDSCQSGVKKTATYFLRTR